jgi:hypothetical protein
MGISLEREVPMSHLMDIDAKAGEVTNHTEFGRQIEAFGRDALDEIAPVFTWFHGEWQNGGCLMLARALQQWSDGALGLAVIRSRRCPEIVQHVICQVGDNLYVDSDGMGTAEDMCRKASDLEYLPEPYLEVADEVTDMGEIIDHKGLRTRLVELMTERLGVFDRGMVEGLGHGVAAPAMR